MKIVVLAWLLLVPSLAALRGCMHQVPQDPTYDSLRPQRSRTMRPAERLQD